MYTHVCSCIVNIHMGRLLIVFIGKVVCNDMCIHVHVQLPSTIRILIVGLSSCGYMVFSDGKQTEEVAYPIDTAGGSYICE